VTAPRHHNLIIGLNNILYKSCYYIIIHMCHIIVTALKYTEHTHCRYYINIIFILLFALITLVHDKRYHNNIRQHITRIIGTFL